MPSETVECDSDVGLLEWALETALLNGSRAGVASPSPGSSSAQEVAKEASGSRPNPGGYKSEATRGGEKGGATERAWADAKLAESPPSIGAVGGERRGGGSGVEVPAGERTCGVGVGDGRVPRELRLRAPGEAGRAVGKEA